MAILSVNNYSFVYPESNDYALKNIDVTINKGEFVVLCGESGSGKTTLLKLLKHDIAPHGKHSGSILYGNKDIEDYTHFKRSQRIGYVFQKPEAQVVMGTVMDELVFGMENIGMDQATMKKRMAEVVQFLGINHLLHQNINILSGGQVQLVNLASILMLYPDVLLLDEPTSQLDPIASQQFIQTLRRLNKEQGMTIIISEHNLEELVSLSDRMLLLEEGKVKYNNTPQQVIKAMKKESFTPTYLPLVTQLYLEKAPIGETGKAPLNVKETKDWLSKCNIIEETGKDKVKNATRTLLTLDKVDFKYNRKSPLILNRISAEFNTGEMHAVLGGNGSGKTTLLKLIANINQPQSGKILLDNKAYKNIGMDTISYLPQNPQLFFIEDRIIDEYKRIASNYQIEDKRIENILNAFDLKALAQRHPYDLSGGQLQKAAIAGALLTRPKVLLLDEPTKGLDPEAKDQLGQLLNDLKENGQTIILVTHDLEFAAKWADRCSLLFNGELASTESVSDFFANNYYYTTVMSRVSRDIVEQPLITLDEAVSRWTVQK